MQKGRWVSYIFRYRNNVKCENAGFIKVQCVNHKSGDEVRIQIGLKMYKKKACRCKAYLIYEKEHAKYLTDIYLNAEERDTTINRVELAWDNPLRDGMAFDIYDGILFVCDDGELLIGMWEEYREYNVVPSNIRIDEQAEKQLNNRDNDNMAGAAEKRDSAKPHKSDRDDEHNASVQQVLYEPKISEEIEQTQQFESQRDGDDDASSGNDFAGDDFIGNKKLEQYVTQESSVESSVVLETSQSAADELPPNTDIPPMQQETAFASEEPVRGNACLEMLRTYPKLPLFTDSQFIECVKIVPQDIGKLAMANWKLGVNSFLSHGYYRYKYIMLGKVKFDVRESYVIGVPGVFTNKEKYLANMFGFNVFIPVKRTNILTGNFGYWISEVLSE